jgi:beta-lactam-binding protein with PASTA domain
MKENNRFLNSYKKKIGQQGDGHHEESSVADKEQSGLRFEQRNGFIKPEKKDPGLTPMAPKKTKMSIAIAIGTVVLVGIIVGLLFLFNRGVEVLDFTGWTENEVQLWARDNGVILQIEQEYNDEFEAGRVISQSVSKGTQVKKGQFVKLTVSLGHDLTVTLPLPDIMSMTKEEIETWAAENFMTKVRITAEYNEEVPLGYVIRYEINDDTVVDEVSRTTPIYIIVSKGIEDQTAMSITIPNFKEMPISECYTFANENGLLLTVEEEYDDYVPAGSIISQSVKADEEVSKGAEITLIISKGKMITIPNFAGYSKEKAVAVAGELGIPVTIKEKYSGSPPGAFISQSIKAGSEYKDKEILELTYSIDNKIVLSSFVGQMRDAIESWAKDLNEQGANITIKVTGTQSNSPKGTILYQDKANVVIGIKTTVKITVSQGKVVFVPDFVAPAGSGYDSAITREKALAMCEELNIVPIFVEAGKSGRLPGEIWSQSMEAGTEITEGSTITLKFVPANVKVTVPDFVGMTKSDILAGNYYKILDIQFADGTEYVDGYVDKVYEQSLRANTKTAAGSIVTLTIGPDKPEEGLTIE